MDAKMFCYILSIICKKALDDGNVCMALLTDLSKAFDCLPYRLLICKLRPYRLSVNACELLKKYFCERKQRVKLGNKYLFIKRSPTMFINGSIYFQHIF